MKHKINVPASLLEKKQYVQQRFLKCRELILMRSPSRILDLGCNTGLFLSMLGEDTIKFGIDRLEPESVMPGITYLKHDLALGIPYPDKSFDAVYSGEVIEHLLDTEGFLRECFRVLKHDGQLVLSTPNLHYWRNILEWLYGNQFFFVDYHNGQEGHVRYFCPKTIKEVTEQAGFKDVRTFTIGDWEGNSITLKMMHVLINMFIKNKNLILIIEAVKPR